MPNQYLPGVITIPSSLIILGITQSNLMVVTVGIGNPATELNTYIPGMLVRLLIPRSYGMYQANFRVGSIQAINGFNFTLNIDSSLFDPFVIPVSIAEGPASLSPAGSRNLQYNNNNINIVPFKNLNNIGN